MEDRNDFYISLPVIALAAVFILYFLNDRQAIDEVQQEVTTLNQSDELSNESIDLYPSQKNTKEILIDSDETRKIESELTASNIHAESPLIDQDPILWSPKEIQTQIPVNEAADKPENIARDNIEPNEGLSATSVNQMGSEKEIVERVEDIAEVLKEDETSSTSNTKDCSIAVGLYRQDNNLQKMLKKLQMSDYDAVQIALKYSTKVAVEIPCDQISAQRILIDIRENFAADAFIE